MKRKILSAIKNLEDSCAILPGKQIPLNGVCKTNNEVKALTAACITVFLPLLKKEQGS